MSTNKNKQQRINQVSRNASLLHPDIYRDKSGRTRAAIILPYFVRAISTFSKNLLCPATAQASIVLPTFARSLSAD